MPLAPIPLASQAYDLVSRPAVAQFLLNMYAEKLPEGSRSPFILKPTPGLAFYTTLGVGPVLSSATIGGSYFAISGTHAYRLQDTAIPAPNDLGLVGGVASSFYHTSIAIGLVGVVFCVPPNAYVADFAGGAVNQIVTGVGDWPAAGASSVCYIDGYYVFTSYDGSYFFTSNLLNPTTFSGLSYVRLSSEVDFVEHCVAHQGDLWLFGQNTVSAWYNSGDPTTPFAPRRTGATIRHGLGAPRSVCELDGSLFWLGVDGCVYRTVGYQAKRVSTHYVEELLSNYDAGYLRTANACAYMHEGHAYYALSLQQIGRTVVYDCATGMWHERCSAANGLGRWDVNTASSLSARVILGDALTGDLWHTTTDTLFEKGVSIPRVSTLPMLVSHGPRTFMSRLEIEMEVGTARAANTIILDWSDDGGTTWSTARTLDTDANPLPLRTRVATTRLGSFRQRVLRLSGTIAGAIYGVDVDLQKGET